MSQAPTQAFLRGDERRFFLLIVGADAGDGKVPTTSVRDLIPTSGIHHKRCWGWLLKWARRDWYQWGVTMDLGWLTPQGRKIAASMPELADRRTA